MKEKETSMANSKYEYVKAFEHTDNLLPHTWIVIRVDGRAFTRCDSLRLWTPSRMHECETRNTCASVNC